MAKGTIAQRQSAYNPLAVKRASQGCGYRMIAPSSWDGTSLSSPTALHPTKGDCFSPRSNVQWIRAKRLSTLSLSFFQRKIISAQIVNALIIARNTAADPISFARADN